MEARSVKKPWEEDVWGREGFTQDLVPCSLTLINQSLKFETLGPVIFREQYTGFRGGSSLEDLSVNICVRKFPQTTPGSLMC